MSFKISSLKTLPEEIEGVEEEYAEGAYVTIARMNNPKYRAYLQKLLRASQHKLLRGMDEDDAQRPFVCKAMAHCVLLGWRGFDNDEGHNDPYTEEKAEKWLLDYDQFYTDIVLLANRRSLFEEAHEKNTAGNLSRASNGTKSGDDLKLLSKK